MQALWKALATIGYLYWAWSLPDLVEGAPYPSERIIVILLFILVMMYQRPKEND